MIFLDPERNWTRRVLMACWQWVARSQRVQKWWSSFAFAIFPVKHPADQYGQDFSSAAPAAP